MEYDSCNLILSNTRVNAVIQQLLQQIIPAWGFSRKNNYKRAITSPT